MNNVEGQFPRFGNPQGSRFLRLQHQGAYNCVVKLRCSKGLCGTCTVGSIHLPFQGWFDGNVCKTKSKQSELASGCKSPARSELEGSLCPTGSAARSQLQGFVGTMASSCLLWRPKRFRGADSSPSLARGIKHRTRKLCGYFFYFYVCEKVWR